MTQTTAAILPYLTLIAAGGGGTLASYVFQRLRTAIPREALAMQYARWPIRLLAWLLYSPSGALLSSTLLAGLMALGAAVLVALLTGADVLTAVDTQLAALVGALSSQYAYRWLGIKPPEARE